MIFLFIWFIGVLFYIYISVFFTFSCENYEINDVLIEAAFWPLHLFKRILK